MIDDAEREEWKRKVAALEEKMVRCPLTGLYNEGFFQEYMRGAVDVSMVVHADGALLFMSIDRLNEINIRHGSEVADETLRKFAAYLPNLVPEEAVLFRLSGALFACYIGGSNRKAGSKAAEFIRSGIQEAGIFAESITVSIGVVDMAELMDRPDDARSALVERILDTAKLRLTIARRMGSNAVCSASEAGEGGEPGMDVVVADADAFRRKLVAELLATRGFFIHEAASGATALDLVTRIVPTLMVMDLSLPGLDAVSLRARMRTSTELDRIPCILITDRKSAETAKRAYALGISVILQRPVLIEEFLGLAVNLTRRERGRAR